MTLNYSITYFQSVPTKNIFNALKYKKNTPKQTQKTLIKKKKSSK